MYLFERACFGFYQRLFFETGTTLWIDRDSSTSHGFITNLSFNLISSTSRVCCGGMYYQGEFDRPWTLMRTGRDARLVSAGRSFNYLFFFSPQHALTSLVFRDCLGPRGNDASKELPAEDFVPLLYLETWS